MEKLYGYAGKILRINLTDATTQVIPSSDYLPEYIGGKMLCMKLFWDEVGPGVGAFDPENKLIFAAGPTTGTGIPTGGRTTMCGISPNALPEQFASGSIGGRVGTVLKYAGYDAVIIEGKAPKPTYVLIDDDKISFLDAELLWGMTVHNTQRSIAMAHGPNVYSMVIGPAGEHMVRIASITTSNDHAFAKTGFGAVFGSKNLKAIAIKGSGVVRPAHVEQVVELRGRIGTPEQTPNRREHMSSVGKGKNAQAAEYDICRFACSPGCTARCQKTFMDQPSAFTGERVDQIEKCVSVRTFGTAYDNGFSVYLFIQSQKNARPLSSILSWNRPEDPSDPDLEFLHEQAIAGDKVDFYPLNFRRGIVMDQLCNEYGMDKWDISMWYFTWLGMAQKEGLLEGLDFGMEVDLNSVEFARHFITSIAYRQGIGDLFAEGMARAIRTLGKEKYGDAPYHGRFSNDGSTPRELPISMETAWGHPGHWTGRGTQGTPKWLWLVNYLHYMVSTRDPIASSHIKVKTDDLRKILAEGPSNSQLLIDLAVRDECASIIKDSITTCEWQAPNPFWPSMEAEMFHAATGVEMTEEDLYAAANRGRLLFRAILMRNHDRCRDMEVPEVYPIMTYPDPNGETATWDEWNDVVDRYYRTSGYDVATGWPWRETWEANGLGDVAAELEKLGKLPQPDSSYRRKPNPIGR